MPLSYDHTTSQVSEPSELPSTLVHSRNLSTISSATLHTNTTLHSQPHEPLLLPTTSGSGEYFDVVSHQSRPSNAILSLPRWSQNHVTSRNSPVVDEKKGSIYSERKPRKRVHLLRWSKMLLETIIAIWSIYSTARYLLAFTIYDSVTGQLASILLGICTGLSFAFTACSTILSLVQTTLLIHGFSVQALLSLRSVLRYLSSICFLGPSVANLVLIFVWRKTYDLELQARHRCKLDLDLVWSTTNSLCNHKTRPWGSWITLSAIRILVTLIIIIAFHLIASSPQFMPTRRLSKPRFVRGKKSHLRLESDQPVFQPVNSHESVVMPHLNRGDPIQQHISESTLSSKSSPRNRLRPSRSQYSAMSGDAPSYNNTDFLPMGGVGHDTGSTGFVDRFRSLISQITRETEDGLEFARSDSASSRHLTDSPPRSSPDLPIDIETADHNLNRDYHHNSDDDDDFYSASPAHPLSSTNNYHQPYPADEEIWMLNGYIRRMPTIESLGSREMRSSLGASSMNRDHARPPTRNTPIPWSGSEFSGSEPRSRPGSLSAQAELLAGMFNKRHSTEIGELTKIRIVDNPMVQEDISEALGEYDSTTSGSKETTQSFHTASSGNTVNSLTKVSPSLLPSQVRSPKQEH